MQENYEIPHLLGNFVGDDGERCNQAKSRTFQKRRTNKHAIDEVVKAVSNENHRCSTSIAMPSCRIVPLAALIVTMPPQDEFFQDEKQQNADQDCECCFLRIPLPFQRMWQHLKKCGPK